MKVYEKLLLENKAWVQEKLHVNEKYFSILNQPRHPQTFWIGCTDSRVAPNVILNRELGDVCKHQNPGPLIQKDDANSVSALYHAIANLHVRHIVVCGHTNCDFVEMSMMGDLPEIMSNWLHPLADLYQENKEELQKIGNLDERADKLAEMSVYRQVENLSEFDFVKKHKDDGHSLWLHGWMFDLKTGLINDVHSL
jgi:carbonic anhydrase